MSVKYFLLIAAVFATSALVAKEAVTPVGLEYCSVCHGSQLMGNKNINAPRLSDLQQWYIERQLLNFKAKIRGNHADDLSGGEMMPMVANFSDDELTDISIWVSTTESPKPMPTIEANIESGKSLYRTCIACHGQNGEGNEALGAPKLSGLNDWYIYNQLNKFRLGIRGTDPKDTYGLQMKAMSNVIVSEQAAADLAAYIVQLD